MANRTQLGFVVAAFLCAVAGWFLLRGGESGAREVGPRAASASVPVEAVATGVMELEKLGQERVEPGAREAVPVAVADDPVAPLREGEAVVEVVVSTRTKRAGGPETSVPNVHVRVGVDPAASLGATSLGAVTTDAAGRATLAIPYRAIEHSLAQASPSIWARVEQTGLMARLARADAVRAKPGGTVNLTVVATPGGTLMGTLFGLDGEPVDGEVRAYRLQDDGDWVSRGWGAARADGHFEIGIRESGTWRLTAGRRVPLGRPTGKDRGRSAGGTAASDVLALEVNELPKDLELRLRGPGLIEGRVLDMAGRPAVGLELLVIAIDASADAAEALGAWVASAGDAAPLLSANGTTAAEYEFAGAGEFGRQLVTDAQGQFEARGLMDGRFVVLAVDASDNDWNSYSKLLTSKPVWSLGPPLELVFDRPYLAVIVHGEGREAAELIGSPYELDFAEAWPGVPGVMVVPAPGRYPEDVPFLASPGSKRSALVYSLALGATLRSEALAPGRFLLQVTMPGGRTASEWVELPPGGTLAVTLAPQ